MASAFTLVALTIAALGGLATFLNFVLDRPRLRIEVGMLNRGIIDGEKHREIVFEVINDGRRAISIMDGGVALSVHRNPWPYRSEYVDASYGHPPSAELPKRLEAGGAFRWTYRMSDAEVEPEFWNAFVQDSRRQYTWAALSRNPIARLRGLPRRSRVES